MLPLFYKVTSKKNLIKFSDKEKKKGVKEKIEVQNLKHCIFHKWLELTCRSNLPGRVKAASSMSGKFVAAMTMIPYNKNNHNYDHDAQKQD